MPVQASKNDCETENLLLIIPENGVFFCLFVCFFVFFWWWSKAKGTAVTGYLPFTHTHTHTHAHTHAHTQVPVEVCTVLSQAFGGNGSDVLTLEQRLSNHPCTLGSE